MASETQEARIDRLEAEVTEVKSDMAKTRDDVIEIKKDLAYLVVLLKSQHTWLCC